MRGFLLTMALLAVPRVALACPVCFGQTDSPLANATNMGILALLGVVVSVLAGFAVFIVHLIRRAHLAEMPTGSTPAVTAGTSTSTPQEGLA